MISKKDIDNLYVWGKQTKFLTKAAPTVSGYTNKKIHHYWLKSTAKTVLIRKKLMSDNIFSIHQNEDILYSGYSFSNSFLISRHFKTVCFDFSVSKFKLLFISA